MKIVGGKYIPGSDGQIGAYVATIYPGGIAEQLHGELQEGKLKILVMISRFSIISDICLQI